MKRKLNKQTRQRISDSLKGRHLTKKHRRNIGRGLRESFSTKNKQKIV